MTVSQYTAQELANCACGISSVLLSAYQNHQLHYKIIDDFEKLQVAAKQAGFNLTIASSYRDFTRQAAIWNAKINGLRSVYDKHQQPVDLSKLSEIDKCHAVMLYSALPGASRHHFGTDLDIYDSAAIEDDYNVQLDVSEYTGSGPFAGLSKWLDANLVKYGFYRPYHKYLGGVACEPWHISHIEQSADLMQYLSLASLEQTIRASELTAKATILDNLPMLYQRYVLNVNSAF